MFPVHDASIPDPNLAKTQKALREIPAALLKITFDLPSPTDRAPPATFWAPYNDGMGYEHAFWSGLLLTLSWFLGNSCNIYHVWERLID